MKPVYAVLFSILIVSSQEAAAPYFSRVREVTISASDRQNYVVLDEEIWAHSRPDLADLRLADGEQFHPYALREESAASAREEKAVKLLNLGSKSGRTEFDLDIGAVSEYDRVRLQLTARNFVASAMVEGTDDLTAKARVRFPPTTLYDFSRENLGSNLTIQLPVTSFRFLHVALNGPLRPEELMGASVFHDLEKATVWTRLAECRHEAERSRMTVFRCEIPAAAPIDRIVFEMQDSRSNFRRDVSAYDAQNARVGGGEISRVRLNRNGTEVSSQTLAIDLTDARSSSLTIEIQNHDDQPLRIAKVTVLSVERRIYFEPQGKTALKLYYGDPKATAPIFDYAKLFREDASASKGELGPGGPNPLYTGRPDDRPWSERHQALLWIAMVVAIAVLGAVALRGLKTGAAATRN